MYVIYRKSLVHPHKWEVLSCVKGVMWAQYAVQNYRLTHSHIQFQIRRIG